MTKRRFIKLKNYIVLLVVYTFIKILLKYKNVLQCLCVYQSKNTLYSHLFKANYTKKVFPTDHIITAILKLIL